MTEKNGNGGAVKMDKRFTEIKDNRPAWKAENAKGKALVGHLMGLLDMPETDNGPWQAFVVRLTEPTSAVDQDGKAIDCKVGDEVLLPATIKLLQKFGQAATHPSLVFEVFVRPTEKVKLNGGRTMWRFELGADMKNPLPRRGDNLLLDGVSRAPKQLGQGAETSDDPGF